MKKLPLLPVLLISPSLLLGQSAVNLGSGNSVYESWTVNTSGGSIAANTLVQRDSSSPTEVVPASAISSWDILGVATGVPVSGSVNVARYGQVLCVLDASGAGTSTPGHLAIMGVTNNTFCADSGQTNVNLVPIGARVVGYFLSAATAGGGATAWVELTPGLMGTDLTGMPLSATSFSTSSNASINGSVYSTQNVYAGTASSAPGCVHLSDSGQTHDMGVCAPASGFSGLLDLPAAGPLWLGSFSSGWQISGITASSGSSPYTCTVTFPGTVGTPATATVTLNTGLSGVTTLNSSNSTIIVSTPGSGYAGPPTTASISTLSGGVCSGTGAFTGANMVTGQLLTASGSDSNGNSTTAWVGLPSGEILVGSGSGAPAPVALSNDCTLNNTGSITCTKTNGVPFAASATTDTTNAGNITSGSLSCARFPSFFSLNSSCYLSWTPQPWTSGTTSIFAASLPTQTGLPSGEVQDLSWGTHAVQISSGNYTNQRAILLSAPAYSYTGATTVTSAAALAVSGPPAAGSSAAFTGSYGLWVEPAAVNGGGTVSNAYALRADAPSGATNNYAAYLNGSTAIGPSAGGSAGPNTTLTVYNGLGSGSTQLVLKAASSQASALFSVNNNSGTLQAQIDANYNATAQMFHSISSAPGASCGAGAGSGCTYLVTASSTNNAGSFQVTTAGTPSATATVATISFAGTVTNTPGACMIGPANAVAARIGSASQPFVSSVSTTSFVVTSNTTALGLTTYAWWYVCM